MSERNKANGKGIRAEVRKWFFGAMTAIFTPFEEGQIDWETFALLIDFQIMNGIKVIIFLGTTGESATLSHNEHLQAIKFAVKQVAGRAKVIIGTGSNNTEEALLMTGWAREAGADGALLISPYYNKPTQPGLKKHFAKIAQAYPDFPLILYNIPGRTASNVEPETIAELSRQCENIVGVKEASGSFKQLRGIIVSCGEDFTVVSGEDALTFPLICEGAMGVISVASNVVPAAMNRLCELALAGDLEGARKLNYQLLPLMDALFLETNPGPGKYIVSSRLGFCTDEVRLPLDTLTDKTKARVDEVLSRPEISKLFEMNKYPDALPDGKVFEAYATALTGGEAVPESAGVEGGLLGRVFD